MICHEKNFENIVYSYWNRFSDFCSSDRYWIVCLILNMMTTLKMVVILIFEGGK